MHLTLWPLKGRKPHKRRFKQCHAYGMYSLQRMTNYSTSFPLPGYHFGSTEVLCSIADLQAISLYKHESKAISAKLNLLSQQKHHQTALFELCYSLCSAQTQTNVNFLQGNTLTGSYCHFIKSQLYQEIKASLCLLLKYNLQTFVNIYG